MKNTIFLGIFILILGSVITYFKLEELDDVEAVFLYLPGVLVGIGLGLIFGSLIGYQSKSKKIKSESQV